MSLLNWGREGHPVQYRDDKAELKRVREEDGIEESLEARAGGRDHSSCPELEMTSPPQQDRRKLGSAHSIVNECPFVPCPSSSGKDNVVAWSLYAQGSAGS